MATPPTNIPFENLSLPLSTFETEILATGAVIIFLLVWLGYRQWMRVESDHISAEKEEKKLDGIELKKRNLIRKIESLDLEGGKNLDILETYARAYIELTIHERLPQSKTVSEYRHIPQKFQDALSLLRNTRYGSEKNKYANDELKRILVDYLV